MTTDKSRLLRLLAIMFAAVALVAGACSDDDGDSGDDGTEEDSGSEDTGGDEGTDAEDGSTEGGEGEEGEDAPTADFSTTVAEASTQVEQAADACELYSAVAVLGTVGNPETAEETREAVDFYVLLVNKMADTSSDEANAEALRTGGQQFQAYAESVDFDPEQMDLAGMGPQFDGADELNEAMNTYGNTEFVDCEGLEGSFTTPEGDAEG